MQLIQKIKDKISSQSSEQEDDDSEPMSRRQFGKVLGAGGAGAAALAMTGNASSAVTTIHPNYVQLDNAGELRFGDAGQYYFEYDNSESQLEFYDGDDNRVYTVEDGIGGNNLLNYEGDTIVVPSNGLQFNNQSNTFSESARLTNHQFGDATAELPSGVQDGLNRSHSLAINDDDILEVYYEYVQSGTNLREVRAYGDTDLQKNKLVNSGRQTNSISSDYTSAGEEALFVDSSSSEITVTLASADVYEGSKVRVVDSSGSAETNNILVETEGTETISGRSGAIINSNYESMTFQSDGSNWILVNRVGGATVIEANATFTVSDDAPNPDDQVTFDASSSEGTPTGPITSYQWDFGDGNTGSGETTNHTYTETGEFTAVLTITTAEGQLTDSKVIDVTSGGSIGGGRSDVRLKKNVVSMDDELGNEQNEGLDALNKIGTYYFDYDQDHPGNEGFDNEGREVGVMAQEVEKVLPEVVGSFNNKGEEYKTVKYDKMVPLLIKAIKELQDELEQVKDKNDS